MIKLILIVIISLENFCQSNKIEIFETLMNSDITGFVVESLQFLEKCIHNKKFFSAFANKKKSLISNIILPLIRTTKDEAE